MEMNGRHFISSLPFRKFLRNWMSSALSNLCQGDVADVSIMVKIATPVFRSSTSESDESARSYRFDNFRIEISQ